MLLFVGFGVWGVGIIVTVIVVGVVVIVVVDSHVIFSPALRLCLYYHPDKLWG